LRINSDKGEEFIITTQITSYFGAADGYHLPVSGYAVKDLDLPFWVSLEDSLSELLEGLNPDLIMEGRASSMDMAWAVLRLEPRDRVSRICILVWKLETDGCQLIMSRGLLNEAGEQDYRFSEAGQTVSPGVELEASFCRMAGAEGIQTAFFDHISSGGYAVGAADTLNGREFFEAGAEREQKSGKGAAERPQLLWKTEVSVISGDAQYIVNAGPYCFCREPGLEGAEKSYGFFFTIWNKDADGRYRFLIDAGNSSGEICTSVFNF